MNQFFRLVKQIIKRVVYRPRGVDMGPGSYIMRPRWLHNPHGIHLGARCWVGRFAIIESFDKLQGCEYQGAIRCGDDVYIGHFCKIDAISLLEIGDGTVLSDHVYVSDVAHGLSPNVGLIMQQHLESKGPVSIGRHVFIGFGASILPGVTLGDHCVVGTRSVVTHSFPAYSMVVGAPARLIKTFDPNIARWVPVERG